MRRQIALGAGLALALALGSAAHADDDYDDTRAGAVTIETTRTTVYSTPESRAAFGNGVPESDWYDERKDPRNLQPHQNPLKGTKWADDMDDDDRDDR